MKRKEKDKNIHDRMTRIRANNFKKADYDVQAHHIEGYDNPKEINGHIPDIIAEKDDEKIIVEVETCDSYDSEDTKEQFEAFESVSDAKFHVVIPKSCFEEAKTQAERWGIKIDKWWWNKSF